MPTPVEVKAPRLQTRAAFRPETANVEARTIDIVMSTGEGVMRHPWWGGPFDGESYLEELEISKKALRSQRLDKGLPLQTDHHRNVGSTVGVAEDWRIEDGKLVATARFSDRNDASREAFIGAREGVLKDFSLGYRIHEYLVTRQDKKKGNAVRAVDWEPLEVSLVAIPAETGANSRADDQELNTCRVTGAETREIDEEETMPPETENEERKEKPKVESAPKITDADVSAAADAARKEGAQAAREFIRGVDELAGKLKLTDEQREELRGLGTIEAARERAVDMHAEADEAEGGEINTASRAEVGREIGRDSFMRGFENSLECRLDAGLQENEFGKRLRWMGLVDQLREYLGTDARDLSPWEVAERASTSNYPSLLANTANKVLQRDYADVPPNWEPLASRRLFNDFKSVPLVRFTEVGPLAKVDEGGEYRYVEAGEQADAYKVAKFGEIVVLSWEMIVNDDLGAFMKIARFQMARAHDNRGDLMWAILTDNGDMGYDGTAMFHADHGNLGSAAALGQGPLDLARADMRMQTTPGGRQLNVVPKVCCVPPALEGTALRLFNAEITAATVGEANIWRGQVAPIVEPRLQAASTTGWYLGASKSSIDMLEYGVLKGHETPQVATRQGFHVDGVEFKIRDVFAAKATEHRGLYFNPGA